MCTACDQYKAAIAGRTEDSSRGWTVFGLMSAINGALLVFLGKDTLAIPMRLMSVFGIILCLLWLSLQLRFAAWVRWWESEARRFEEHIPKDLRLFRGRRLQSRNPLKVGFSSRATTIILPVLFVCAWVVVALTAEQNSGAATSQTAPSAASEAAQR